MRLLFPPLFFERLGRNWQRLRGAKLGLFVLVAWSIIVATGGDPAEGRGLALWGMQPEIYRILVYATGLLAAAWALFFIVSFVYEAWTGRELFEKPLRNRPFIEVPPKRSTPDVRDDRGG